MEIGVRAPVRVSEASVGEGAERRAWGLLTRQDLGLEGVDGATAVVRGELLCTRLRARSLAANALTWGEQVAWDSPRRRPFSLAAVTWCSRASGF